MSKRSLSICHARPDTLTTSATFSVSVRAPSSRNRARPSASRAVAVTVAPAARYWRTNSRPMPREAPMTMTFIGTARARRRLPRLARSEQFHRHRRGFAAADAQRGHALLPAVFLQRPQQRDHHACAAGADRVTQRTGAAVHVDLLVRQLVVLH